MLRYILIITFILITMSQAQWPEDIPKLRQSICLVEYFQPHYEVREIKDDSRFKKKITGILVNESGLIMTSDVIFPATLDIVSRDRFYSHMQSPPEDISVIFDSDTRFHAELVGIDEEYRVAFIQITDDANLPEPVEFKGRDENKIGDKLFLVQHLSERFNSEIMVTNHRINALLKKPFRKILTTTTFSPLSAGGLAINETGDPIGIIYRSQDNLSQYEYEMDISGGGSFITQILPGDYLSDLIKDPPRMQLQKNGTGKSWVGIQMQILKDEMADYWGIPGVNGIIINYVLPQSPAEKAGLQTGDIITSIDGFQIQGEEDQDLELFRNFIRSLPEGPVQIEFIRQKKKTSVKVILESAPMSKFFAEEYSEEFMRFSVKELTQDIILENDLNFEIEGVWVSRVEEAGAASLSGLMVHDLILKINNKKVQDLTDFKARMVQISDKKPEYVQLFVQRANKTVFVFVKTTYELNSSSEG